jgi:protein-S-isoprenylcysteine O-methyltransferase Ste14
MNESVGQKTRISVGSFLYGLTFVGLVPAYLVVWARSLDHLALPPVPNVPGLGQALVALGVVPLVVGIWSITSRGNGLPMNAYPPTRYVRSGIYYWFSHPIYFGFCIACAGISILFQSIAGLWVITPVVSLCSAALVWGYERADLIDRFGVVYFDHWFRLPIASSDTPGFRDYVSVIGLVFLPWLVLYQGVASYIGVIDPVWNSTLPFEEDLAVFELAGLPYVLTYPFVALAPFVARTKQSLREFSVGGLLTTALVIPFYLTLPVVAAFRPFEPATIWGQLIVYQQSFDNPATALPAFHVIWTFLAARLIAHRFARASAVIWAAAWIMAVSSWLSGMHAILDIAAGALVYALASSYGRVWNWIRGCSEKIANSWLEWRIGPLRIINHGFYAGLAGFTGFLIIASILGPSSLVPTLVMGIILLATAGIWAQVVEGSDRLLRPFGYYGAVFGSIIGAIVVEYWFGIPSFASLGAFSVAAPFVQAIGRLRCLVQGCCHGASAPERVGIRVTEPNSRVCHLASLRDTPIHPTPVYSIIGNLLVGLVVFRLLALGTPGSVIAGFYLILSSVARFVEESYRGEPQTPVILGLKIYQWLGIGFLVLGSVLTMIPGPTVALIGTGATGSTWVAATIYGLVCGAAMGVDLPDSNKRFTRLT